MSQQSPGSPVTREVFEGGDRIRRATLGDAYVDRSWQQADEDPFLAPLQQCVSGLAWGGVWGREGLDKKTRSIITVSCLLALGRRHELTAHLRGAINNGCTIIELQEMIIHAGCYCGWPAAVDGFRLAKEVLDAMAAEAIAPPKP
jgi:4-carboxymuconolactone decarboxylase